MKSLQGEAGRLESTLARQKSGYADAGQNVATLEGNLNALALAQRAAREEGDRLNASLAQQAKAAAVRPTIERATGVTRDRGDYDQLAAKLREEAATAADREAAAIARLRSELNPAAALEARLAAETEKLANWLHRGEISADEHRQALALLKGEADRTAKVLARAPAGGRGAFLGLEPYQLQNLSFQVNDVFTQLASGTSLMQTLGQQGGQIIQIFPRVGSAIAAGLTSAPVIALVAVFGTLVAAMSRAADQAERLRTFNGILAANADGAAHSAERLSEATGELRRYGVAAEDALAAVRKFNRDGIADSRIEEFGRAAADTAEVMGVDLKQAADDVSQAFTGGFEAVKKLDDATNFLTAAQRDQIESLFEQGRATEAQNLALGIYSAKMEEAAEKQRGAWASAARELSAAWSDLLDEFADLGPIKGATSALETLARNLAMTLRAARGASTEADLLQRIAATEVEISNLRRYGGANNPFLQQALERKAALEKELQTVQRRNYAEKAGAAIVADQTEQRAKQSDSLRTATAAAKENKSLAEAEADALRKANEFLDKNFKFADDATKAAYRQQELEKVRADYAKRAADSAKKEADQRERSRREAERLSKQTAFIMPVDGPVKSGFGPRKAPTAGASTYHRGIDIAAPIGTPVKAPADGVVIETGTDSKLGKFIYIDHGGNVVSKFGHLSDNSIATGTQVTKGDVIGRTGNSGLSTGPHLHYGVEVNGKPVDPRKGMFPADGAGRFAIDAGEAIADLEDKQDKFNEAIDAENLKRRETIDLLTAQQGLRGIALIEEQKRQFVEEAVNSQRARAAKEGLSYTADQEAATRSLAAQEFELTRGITDRAEARRDELDASKNPRL